MAAGGRKAKSSRAARPHAGTRGFTLVEVVVVVSIIAILSVFAVKYFKSAQIKSNRAAAEAFLGALAQQEQQYFLDYRAYACYPAGPSCTSPLTGISTPANVSAYYTVSATPGTGSPPSFTATAAPIAGTYQQSDYTLTIDNTGAKTPSGVW